MKITFLGTGTSQGIPVIGCNCAVCCSADTRDKRLRTSAMVETGGRTLIIDTGPDFRQQLLREKITEVDAYLLTHGHKDHLAGLDDVRALNYFMQSPAHVYASSDVIRTVRKEFSYAFRPDPYPGVPVIELHRINNKAFNINHIPVIPIKATHYRNELYVFGYRIEDFTYITDAIHISDNEKEKIRGSKVLVLNALRKKKHYSHFNLQEALDLMDELKPDYGYLTHISHQMGLHDEVERELPPNVKLAYDGLSITF